MNMIIVDLIKEYALIARLMLTSLFKKSLPEEWKTGDKGDVILIQGLHSTYLALAYVGNFLNSRGYKIHTIPNLTSVETIEQAASKLESTVKSIDKPNLILVSHSKGGLISKYFLDHSQQNNKVRYSFSIATPYSGSLLGMTKIHNIHELGLKSSLILDLGKNKQNVSKIVNFYPKFDNHVIPNKSLLLDGATNIPIDVNGHTNILTSTQLTEQLGALLDN